ncbi:Bro-N domain-containing protein [Pseudomonas sp. 13B_3.2_Bac1]|uniref:BRO-N domain-containing protein n=1 Tax=Pseudomonas sp. 13B_3.2_Bac1 TaxID=2971623 RepID=UPI0021CA50BB|nr:BRO family protein [Pseudomonas sp. 13B_3.2_Bac1]MCU1772059.1 BRO family protein [Pseudomonas sp. 13B_3.2_Bac1]
MSDSRNSTVFTPHNLHLHSLLPEKEPWSSARDIDRLMGVQLSDRMVARLDKVQYRFLWINHYRQPEKLLMISESGVYALLMYHYVPENRLLRERLTHLVVPTLRDSEHSISSDRPMSSLLNWPEMSLSLVHWQDESWIRLRDMPYLRNHQSQRQVAVPKPWWRRVTQVFQPSKHLMG